MQDAYSTPAPGSSHRGDIRPRDRVVTTQNNRDGTSLSNLLDLYFQRCTRGGCITGKHFDVTGVYHAHVLQSINAHRQRRARTIMRQVVGHPNSLWPHASTGAIGRSTVKGCTHDHHIS